MLVFNETVFDDGVGADAVYTGVQFARLLGRRDQLAIQVMTYGATARTTLTLAIELSHDGVRWAPKSTVPEINGAALSSTGATALFGADAGTSPSMGLVRLSISLSARTAPQAYVVVYVSARDRGKDAKACACPAPSPGARQLERRTDLLRELMRDVLVYPSPQPSHAARFAMVRWVTDPKGAAASLDGATRGELGGLFDRMRAALVARGTDLPEAQAVDLTLVAARALLG